ncbi:hypothetical protein [Brachybacterium sp. FME24]|uniref:hypothetical protein n=1 Tax=Brachybacterium sp. FME24 TaxID=2742605 RepID=UPI001D03F4D1|nr:hypothetical protein [Brachybacterium sp. FME24]
MSSSGMGGPGAGGPHNGYPGQGQSPQDGRSGPPSHGGRQEPPHHGGPGPGAPPQGQFNSPPPQHSPYPHQQQPPPTGPGGPSGPVGPGGPGSPGGQQPSPKRPWGLIAVALGCIGALVLVIGGGLTVFLLTRGGDEPTAVATTEPTSQEPSESDSAPDSETPPEESAPATEEGAGFEVIPQVDIPPGDADDLWAIMADNPLTQGSLPDVATCDLPEIQAGHDSDELQAQLDATSTCLNQVWAGASADRGLPWNSPSIAVYTWPDAPASATCDSSKFEEGDPRMCNLDGVLYWPEGSGIGATAEDAAEIPGAYMWDLSGEYIYAVIWNSSLGSYYAALTGQLEDDPDRQDDASRLYGLQRMCLTAAATEQMPSDAQVGPELSEALVDPANWTAAEDDLFSSETRTLWIQKGFESGGDLSVCNTWNAPADELE